jgi:hypothetical protein
MNAREKNERLIMWCVFLLLGNAVIWFLVWHR